MEIEQVQDAINAAFPDAPIPSRRTLIRHLHRRDRPGEEKIRNELAGKSWRSLTPKFLAARWSAFCYLSPEAYCYYLASLLSGVLHEFSHNNPLTLPVVRGLCPDYWSLYYEGDDQQFRDREAAFNLAQYRAVCAFLGLVFDRIPRWRYMAAQALRWGWNRHDTPALGTALEYYHKMHTFSYPEPETTPVADLCREICSAFAMTPYPGDDRLCGSEQGDEPAECAMEFRSLKWQSVHPELLAHNGTALSFLSDAGFRYFLPAFLLADLYGYESNANPVFSLTHDISDTSEAVISALEGHIDEETLERMRQEGAPDRISERHRYSELRFAGFTHDERTAIIRYLEFRAEDEWEEPAIRQALESYWRPSAQ